MTRPVISINGRFLAAPASGVQRVARELVAALDASLQDEPGRVAWRLLRPDGAGPMAGLEAIAQQTAPGLSGVAWEQATLPRASAGGLLLNLANTAPVMGRGNIVMLHDAQVYDAPASYSAAFRAWYRLMQPRVCRGAVKVLTVSRHSATRLAANGVIRSADDAVVIHNGVDHILAAGSGGDVLVHYGLADRPFLMAFGSTQPHKNAALIVKLAADERLAGFDFAVAGASLPEGMARDNIRLLGRVDDAHLRALYQGAFAFLLPSVTEGFGLPAGEAMICGCPVISSPGGALAEVWGEAAMLAAPDDPDAWVQAILSLARPEAREALRDRGRTHAGAFTWRAAAAALRRVCEEAALR